MKGSTSCPANFAEVDLRICAPLSKGRGDQSAASHVIQAQRETLTLTSVMPADCWIGCDRALPLKLKVNELTRAEREGRSLRGKPLPTEGEDEGAAQVDANGEASEDDEDASEEDGAELYCFLPPRLPLCLWQRSLVDLELTEVWRCLRTAGAVSCGGESTLCGAVDLQVRTAKDVTSL